MNPGLMETDVWNIYIYIYIYIYIWEYVCRYTIMYGSSIHAPPGTQVTTGTDTIFAIFLCYSLLLAMYIDIAKIENRNIKNNNNNNGDKLAYII